MNPDAVAFHAFEQRGWESAAAQYDDAFAGLTGQAIGPLLDALAVGPGGRFLDVATGPGYVAAAAADRGARVTGIDFSSAMVALARSRHPAIEFADGDAEALSFPAGTFDAVGMNFGMLHLARPDQAIAEALRVLRPGGRYAFTVWTKPEEAIGFGIVLNAIQAHGNPDVALPQGPPFFRFSDPEECKRAMTGAGFTDVHVQSVAQTWRLAAPDGLFDAMVSGTVRTKALLRAQSGEALQAIRAAVRKAAAAHGRDGALLIPMPAVLASARKKA